MGETEIGKVTHWFSKIGVATLGLTETLKVGDRIRIKGATTNFTQDIDSMHVDNKPAQEGGPGQKVAIKVKEHVRENDVVYRIEQ
jgi:translation elongation factor EF-1alpha